MRDPVEIEGVPDPKLDRCARFALAAARVAWSDAGLGRIDDPYEAGVVIGSSHGGEATALNAIRTLCTAERPRVSARLIPRMLANMPSAHVAIDLGLRGPSFAVTSACATGAQAIGEAAEIIRRGDARIMVCGGADACITPLTVAGDQAAGALSTRSDDPASASRPFDRSRDGFVIGEGAGILVLEERSAALWRGARIRGEIAGYAATTDAHHETRPDPDAEPLARAIDRAVEKAGISRSEIDAIFAHATGTVIGDAAEAAAFRRVFGDGLREIPVTAIKGGLGHLMGAAGSVQAIVALQALDHQMLPPTRNCDDPDPTLGLSIVAGEARPARLSTVLSTSSGFGGHNVALVLQGSRTQGAGRIV